SVLVDHRIRPCQHFGGTSGRSVWLFVDLLGQRRWVCSAPRANSNRQLILRTRVDGIAHNARVPAGKTARLRYRGTLRAMRTHRHTAGFWSVFEAPAAGSMTSARSKLLLRQALRRRLSSSFRTFHCKPSMGVVQRAAIDSRGYWCKVESRPCGSSHLVVHYTRTLCVATWQERQLAMLPNVILLVFAALAVFVPVVAHPIQDMSQVSITHKTVGNRLPCLWCGAIGRRTKHPLTESICYSPCSKNETLFTRLHP